jgi:hypothetical protein
MTQKYLIPPYGEVINFGVRLPLTHFLNTLRLPDIMSKIGVVTAIVIHNTIPIGNSIIISNYAAVLSQVYYKQTPNTHIAYALRVSKTHNLTFHLVVLVSLPPQNFS